MTETTALPPEHSTEPLFVRPREGRMLAGVCAGIAQRWSLDVTLVRIIAVVLALLSGVGVVAYVAAWLLTPSVDGPAPLAAGSPLARSVTGRRGGMRRLGGLLLVVLLGLIVLGIAHSFWFGVPIGLVVVATLLVLAFGTRLGRWALLAFAILVALTIGVVGAFGGSFGTRTIHVASIDDLHSSYDYGAGTVRLDLSALSAVSGEHETSVRVGRGSVTVTVPAGMPVFVHAKAGVGSVTVNGHKVSGLDAEQSLPIGPGSATASDRLDLDVTVGVGTVKVRTA
ncbi:MAG TPA: PspC domain-containing protein [Mycobacteriales bacterium]|nr:PspC domain-containing protein [Mycobacteriales bacterium]